MVEEDVLQSYGTSEQCKQWYSFEKKGWIYLVVFPDACCSKLVHFCVSSTHDVDQQSDRPFWIFQSWSCLEYNVVKNKREKNPFSKHIGYSKNRQGEHRCRHTLQSSQLPNFGRFRKEKAVTFVFFTMYYIDYKTGRKQEVHNILQMLKFLIFCNFSN